MTAILAATTVVVAVAVPEVHAAGGTISGVVTDSAGNPIAGATVRAATDVFGFDATPAVLTDATGAYAIAGITPKPLPWKVAAGSPGYGRTFNDSPDWNASQGIVVAEGGAYTADFTLFRADASYSGTILDDAAQPLAGAIVVLALQGLPPSWINLATGGGVSPVVTGPTGQFSFGGLPPGDYHLSVNPPADRPDLLAVGNTVPQTNFPIAESQVIVEDSVLHPGGTVTGTVTNTAGQPLVGAFVNFDSPSGLNLVDPVNGLTDVNGRFRVVGVPPGQWKVVVSALGTGQSLPQTYWHGDYFDGQIFDVASGQTLDGIDVQMSPGAIISPVLQGLGSGTVITTFGCRPPGEPILLTDIPGALIPQFPGCSDQRQPAYGSFGGVDLLPAGELNLAAYALKSPVVVPSDQGLLSTIIPSTLTAGDTLSCAFNVDTPSACQPEDPAVDDGDGAYPVFEDMAPGGDGNSDGIRDATQNNVASLLAARASEPLTIAVDQSARLSFASITLFETPSFPSPAEVGDIFAEVTVAPGSPVDVRLVKSTPWTSNGVISNGVTLPPSDATFDGNVLTVHVSDGVPANADGSSGTIFVRLTPQHIDRTPPTITCPATPIFVVGEFGSIVVTAQDTDSGLRAPFGTPGTDPFGFTRDPVSQTLIANTAVVGHQSVHVSFVDRSGNTATADCSYEVVADDGDGVPPFIEDRAPNRDGNGDGIRDAVQSNVASFVPFGSTEVFTAAAPAGTQLSSVFAFNDLVGPVPGLPGRVALGPSIYAVAGQIPTSPIDIDIIRTGTWTGNEIRSAFSSPWAVVPATISGQTATLHLTDGGNGDADLAANGSISLNATEVSRETTPPTVECGAIPSFPQGQPGIVTATASDAGSGVENASLTQQVDTSAQGTFSVSFTATDLAGNATTQSCNYVVTAPPPPVDTTPPEIICPESPSFLLNQPNATVTADISDFESGVDAATATVSVPTSTVGFSSMIVVATDRAGNTGFAFCGYNVGVKLDRLITPNPALTTLIKANRPVPIRWRALDFNGAPVTDPSHFLGVDLAAGACVKERTQGVDTVRNRGLRYLGNGRWEYDWAATPTKGCYTLTLNLTGVSQTARIRVS